MNQLGFAQAGQPEPAPAPATDPARAQQLSSWSAHIQSLIAKAEAEAQRAGNALPAPTWPAISKWAKEHKTALIIAGVIFAALIVLNGRKR